MSKFVVYIPANIYDGKWYDFQTYRVTVEASSEEEAKKIVINTKDDIIEKASKARTTSGKFKVRKPAQDNMFFFDKNGKPKDFYVRKEKETMKENQKSWKDRMPPAGHLPAAYEIQVCDEGNKVIAVQMLDKSGIEYKISARKGQFYIQAPDMTVFTKIRQLLNQSMDMNKEADKLGFKPEIAPDVTPVGTNTPSAEINASTVAVTEPVKEDLIEAKTNVDAVSAAENIYNAYDTSGSFWSEAKIKKTLALAYSYGQADAKGSTRPVPTGLPKKRVKEPEVKRDSSKFDKKLSKYWEDYFLANYDFDDFTNHGGGSVANAKKKVYKIFDKVESEYGKNTANKMVQWAEDAYERAYYGRDKSWKKLIAELPDTVDSKWIEEEYM